MIPCMARSCRNSRGPALRVLPAMAALLTLGLGTALFAAAPEAPGLDRAPSAWPDTAPRESGDPAATAFAAFESLKALAGKWIGRSTKGWEEEITIKVIAGGSVVVVNSFDAHPGEEMLTTYFLDGDELQLKHYCMAKNQPRLAATAISPDGREITFTFKDATGIPSRNQGHMDKALYRLGDDDSFSSQWTWYQDGKESWMEEIQYRRVR